MNEEAKEIADRLYETLMLGAKTFKAFTIVIKHSVKATRKFYEDIEALGLTAVDKR